MVGAYAWPSPVGLAVGEILNDGSGVLRSISVASAYRRLGLATRLLQEVQRQGSACGLHTLAAQYVCTGQPRPELGHLLARCGWRALAPTGVECVSTHAVLSRAPWMKLAQFPRGFEALRWRDLSDSDLSALKREQERSPGFPKSLDPFKHLDQIDLPSSQALRFQGRIIGWCVNRRTAPHDLYCTSLFVREQFQARGHAIRLLAYTLRNLDGMQIEKTAFDVSFLMQGMIGFFERHMLPYMSSVRTFYHSSLALVRHMESSEALQ